jgi:hypothetical protein
MASAHFRYAISLLLEVIVDRADGKLCLNNRRR